MPFTSELCLLGATLLATLFLQGVAGVIQRFGSERSADVCVRIGVPGHANAASCMCIESGMPDFTHGRTV